MLLTEFDEKAYIEGVKKQSYADGVAEGETEMSVPDIFSLMFWSLSEERTAISPVFSAITEVWLFPNGPADDWVKRSPQIRHKIIIIKISSRFR